MSDANQGDEGPTKGRFGVAGLPVSRRYVYPVSRNRIWWIGLGVAGVIGLMLLVNLGLQDGAWVSNGPLSSSHAVIGGDCVACHTPFGEVSSDKCALCHDSRTDTLGGHTLDAHYVYVSGDRTRAYRRDGELACVGCHTEHGGRFADLTTVGDTGCVACHGFDRFGTHPEFDFEAESRADDRGLAFTHIRHVDRVMEDRGTGDLELACLACHTPTPDASRFAPIAFEAHCADCHLGGDVESPELHGPSPPRYSSNGILVRLELATSVAPQDVVDVLIVGGGPAGTAAAFRAKELGLAPLVIEIDDVLRRIRDYDESKPIKPDFGAGRQMGFPKGAALIEQLHFFSDVKGGELSRAWKQLYRDHSVPVQIGVELLGLEPGPEGAWRALVRNHRTETDGALVARHVVLAIGAGMPRRLDVPGDVRAIAAGLAGAQRYVGATACVIGAGVSAVEAVIAISSAKAAVADETAVYWSHRGQQMPRVPQALEAALSRATDVHKNVRLLPGSEAREVVATDHGAVLRIQSSRREVPGGPVEVTQVEFDAGRVVACIGQEIDWTLMHGIGLYQVTGGPRSRKAMPLNALLESRQPNVYVIGDTLNTAYLECEDFDGDASLFKEVKHQGNIKASLADGVKVAEVIAQKLAGQSDIRVELEFVGVSTPTPAEADASHVPEPGLDRTLVLTPAPAPPVAGTPPAVLVRLIDREVEAEQFVLCADRETSIGRRGCDIAFGEDSRLADRHATVAPDGDGYLVRDGSSRDGVFLHLTDGNGRAVTPGTIGRVGAQWVVFGTPDDPLVLVHHDARGRRVGQHRLREGTQILGRAAPDITLTATDMSLSRRHASVVVTGRTVYLRDLNSANGTFVKVHGTARLADGDLLRLGHQALRFGFIEVMARSKVLAVDTGRLKRPHGGSGVAATSADGQVVVFQNRGQTCPFKPGQTLCDVAEEAGVAMKADCHKGICGSDPVRIVAGKEHLDPMSDEERDTLEDICAVDPVNHRLACRARPTGLVVVEVLDQ